MDSCLFSYTEIALPQDSWTHLSSTPFPPFTPGWQRPFRGLCINKGCFVQRAVVFTHKINKKPLVVKANQSQWEYSGLTVPLVPKSGAGKLLSSVLLNEPQHFQTVAQKQLEQLAYDRDDAVRRMNLSLASEETLLHRKIAELKKLECRNAVEDIMYMLIVYKFSEVRVHLVPRLSKCMYNGRLEIWPCMDWELESIHSIEVLKMVREHLSTVIGWKEKSSVTENWAPTQVKRLHLCQIYAASILFGYFMKSASLRHQLEQSLHSINTNNGIATSSSLLLPESWPAKQNSVPFGHSNDTQSTSVGQLSLIQGKKQENLRSYVTSFDHETMHMCAKPKCKEALNLIEKHCCALFGEEKTGPLKSDEVVSTSLASLKRIVLEAVAFGSFLWDSEHFIMNTYKLEENEHY